MIEQQKIVPIILAGGHGSRLWPASTPDLPKQFIPLKSGGTTFQGTLARVQNAELFSRPIVICSAQNLKIVACLSADVKPHIIGEPIGRNTAPACAIGSLAAQEFESQDALVLILPADHYIPDVDLFEIAVQQAASVAQSGKIVTFGIRPEFGHTEYGYIEQGDQLGDEIYRVKSFAEKPRIRAAQSYYKDGNYFWNAGIFLVRADVLLSELKLYQNDVFLFSQQAWEYATEQEGYHILDKDILSKIPKISLDHAIMEQTSNACVLVAGFKWRDLGGWDALMEFSSPHSLAS